MIMKIIDLCDVKYIMTLPIKTITSVLNDSTYIINSTTSCSIKLNAILTIVYINLHYWCYSTYIMVGSFEDGGNQSS